MKITLNQTFSCSTICVMLLLSLQLNAQNFTLKGRVADTASRQPLSDASIVLPGGAAKTVTNAQGYFTLQLTTAKGSIIVSYIGYRAKQVNYQLPKDSSLLIFFRSSRYRFTRGNCKYGLPEITQRAFHRFFCAVE